MRALITFGSTRGGTEGLAQMVADGVDSVLPAQAGSGAEAVARHLLDGLPRR